jgi:hypothetical protein
LRRSAIRRDPEAERRRPPRFGPKRRRMTDLVASPLDLE